MRIDVMTLFPDMMKAAFSESIIARGVNAGFLDLRYHQIRDYTDDKHGKVDDYPFGGGPGLIMAYQPIAATLSYIKSELPDDAKPYVIYMSPQGKVFNQSIAKELSKKENLVILCGHYEGVDERVIEDFIDEEISIGDFVLTGGELPACVLIDTVSRLVPGVLASEEATDSESHSDTLLEYPQYTRPAEINGKKVPEILLSGNHADIEAWRLQESLKRTHGKRPDIITDIYLDNSATTRQLPEVIDEVARVSSYVYGNPSSLHRVGFNAEKELRKARQSLAGILGAEEDEIIFTSSASESNNQALRCVLEAYPRFKGGIAVTAGEHPSVYETAEYLKTHGRELTYFPLNEKGIPDIEKIPECIKPDTALVSLVHVNSETGAVTPVKEIAAICKKINPDIIIHTDCTQSFCKIPVEPKKWNVDLVTVGSQKIHGPRGAALLYKRKDLKITPLIYGGGQEKGLRSGTENLPAICGFAKAAEILYSDIDKNYSHVKELNEYVRSFLAENLSKAQINSDEEYCSPYILNVSFPHLGAEVILHSLEDKGVFVSTGSACSSHKKDRSKTLISMGFDIIRIDGAIRISFSHTNTLPQVKRACDSMAEQIKLLYKRKRH